MQTTADRLLAKKKKELEQERLTEEEAKDLKKACRDLFSTQKGIKVARYMMRASGIYRLNKNTQNPLDMGRARQGMDVLNFCKRRIITGTIIKN